jgi:hypothetical protein
LRTWRNSPWIHRRSILPSTSIGSKCFVILCTACGYLVLIMSFFPGTKKWYWAMEKCCLRPRGYDMEMWSSLD